MTPVLPAGSAIALIGAPGSGKRRLAAQLLERLAQRGLSTPVLRFEDPALCGDALAARSGTLIALLMALDLPPDPSEDVQDHAYENARRERIDAALRAALARAAMPFAVIHGQGPERLSNAWTAIHAHADAVDREAPLHGAASERGWAWSCDKCSDPGCEHRLFSDLMARRG